MGASDFPRVIDTDTQLIRVTSADPLTIEDHNNLVDALEAIEATLGTSGDGSEPAGGIRAFRGSVADYAGFLSTGQLNPRAPFLPYISVNEWHARVAVTPAGWTLGAGMAVAYTHPVGLARLTLPSNAALLMASCPVVGSDPMYVVLRVTMARPNADHIAFGWSANGLGTDIDGLCINAVNLNYLVVGGVLNNVLQAGDQSLTINGALKYLALRYVSGQFAYAASQDGVLWSPWFGNHARTGAYTRFCIYLRAAMTTLGPLWLDFVSFGTALPSDWGGE